MRNRKKIAVITGGAGFIGSHMVDLLLAKKYNLRIIEDAAQGMGSYYNKLHAGSFSDVAAFSTHPLKNLNALGDGGFITTNSKKIY